MLSIETIFKEYSPKYRPQGNEWRMSCPFRENHSGMADGGSSFFVNAEKNYYNCFSCKEHGPLLQLLTTRMKIPFIEAFELVSLTNIDHLFKGTRVKKEEEVFEPIIPLKAPEPFLARGFGDRLLRQFRVGEQLDKFGKPEILIPVHDSTGRKIVGVKYRQEHNFWYMPKGFDKENYLYNFHNCVGREWCVIVEGETDVYQSAKNGILNVCATMGGILSEQQAKLIALAGFQHVVTAFDNDQAGFVDTERAHKQLKAFNIPMYVAPYDAEDPGCCEQVEWVNAVTINKTDYVEYSTRMMILMGSEYDKIKYSKKSKK